MPHWVVRRFECRGLTLNFYCKRLSWIFRKRFTMRELLSFFTFKSSEFQRRVIVRLSRRGFCQPAHSAGAAPLSSLLRDWSPGVAGAAGAGYHLNLPGPGTEAPGQPRHQLLALTRPQVGPQGAEAVLVGYWNDIWVTFKCLTGGIIRHRTFTFLGIWSSSGKLVR